MREWVCLCGFDAGAGYFTSCRELSGSDKRSKQAARLWPLESVQGEKRTQF